jgi:hypothetical protein
MSGIRPLYLTISCFWFAALFTADLQADPGSQIGGGNVALRKNLSLADAQFKALGAAGASRCRFPVSQGTYYDPKHNKPVPEKYDELVLLAHKRGITPMILFEYYTRWNGPIGGREKWHTIGRAFALRFAPNSEWLKSKGVRDWGITCYTAVNEPTWKSNNPTPIVPKDYAKALEGLADGVHSVARTLTVSPGGYIEGSLHGGKNPYLKAAAPLYNAGKLHAIDIHRYWDVKYVTMTNTRRFSLQSQFDDVKRDYGIKAGVKFHTTEMNFKKRMVTEDQAARGFLTALWDALGVVDAKGRRITQFVMPWNIFHLTDKDIHYGLCTKLTPWTPTGRGKVLQLVCRVSKDMEFVSCDPRNKGTFVLEGTGRKLWVWQNRTGWTDKPGTTFILKGIPKQSTKLEVYRYNSWNKPWKELDVSGKDSVELTNLPPDETLMFLSRR